MPEAKPDGDGLRAIETLDWAGSADLRTVASADGFAVFPGGDRDFAPEKLSASSRCDPERLSG